MKALKSFLCLVKIASKDIVDVIVIILFIAVGFVDIFTSYDFTGGLLFFAVYAFATVLRMAWWKRLAARYVEDESVRESLGFPENGNDC